MLDGLTAYCFNKNKYIECGGVAQLVTCFPSVCIFGSTLSATEDGGTP